MTEGTKTYAGLAVPLFGESEIRQQDISRDILTLTSHADNTSADFLVCQDSDGTEPFVIEDDGRCRINRSGTFSEALSAFYTCTIDDPSATQEYAVRFMLDEGETNVSGGRRAVLDLRFNAATAGAHAAKSFINIDQDGELGTSLFTILCGAPDGGGLAEIISNPNSTIGLVIYVNNVKMWILCSSVST